MAKLLGIRIKNYRALEDVGIGQTRYGQGVPLPGLSCFIGPNGAGKSTLLDAFGFLADCLLEGVESACDKPGRGGFDRLLTQGATGPIEFELFFDAGDASRPIGYSLAIEVRDGVPIVVKESLRQRRSGQARGKPYYFLKLTRGRGKVWAGDFDESDSDTCAERVVLADPTRLGVGTLGNLGEHPRIVALRSYIEQWYLSYFVPDAARTLPPAGAQRWLDRTGSNLGNVLQYFERQHKAEFGAILARVAKAIPGLKKITPKVGEDKRMLLRFDEAGYVDPFYQNSMSDGTLKMAAYAVLLCDPHPRPFIGIEEPENGLYVALIEGLARQLVEHSRRQGGVTQILVTTHSPYFVDALTPEQVWILRKGVRGRVAATRAADLPRVRAMADEGLPLGSLWYSRHLEERRRWGRG
ncbi:MAG: AAA family ATPase [Polyangiaceae bacterium]|nr:AAA family ATPase [Polyangiaceae bacterium]